MDSTYTGQQKHVRKLVYIYIYIHVLRGFEIRAVVPERLKITDAIEQHAVSMIGSFDVISGKDKNTLHARSDSQRYARNRMGEKP
jgi:hypothetical protein